MIFFFLLLVLARSLCSCFLYFFFGIFQFLDSGTGAHVPRDRIRSMWSEPWRRSTGASDLELFWRFRMSETDFTESVAGTFHRCLLAEVAGETGAGETDSLIMVVLYTDYQNLPFSAQVCCHWDANFPESMQIFCMTCVGKYTDLEKLLNLPRNLYSWATSSCRSADLYPSKYITPLRWVEIFLSFLRGIQIRLEHYILHKLEEKIIWCFLG